MGKFPSCDPYALLFDMRVGLIGLLATKRQVSLQLAPVRRVGGFFLKDMEKWFD